MRQSEVFRGPPKQILSGLGGIRSGCDFAVCLCDAALGYGLPPEYGSWLEYIRDLDHLSGTKALPAFYAAEYYLGGAGIWILMASLLALILTSLIGNITALSRLFYALGRDGVLPSSLGELNRHGVPGKAIGLIALVSALVRFLGRTAIGWIVDVTTLGATLIYGFVSAAAWKTAGFRGDRTEKKTGLIGMAIMICFGVYLLVPNLFTTGSMEPESYFLFVVWSVLGFVVFRAILKHDGNSRFGKSVIVWIALLSMILFVFLSTETGHHPAKIFASSPLTRSSYRAAASSANRRMKATHIAF